MTVGRSLLATFAFAERVAHIKAGARVRTQMQMEALVIGVIGRCNSFEHQELHEFNKGLSGVERVAERIANPVIDQRGMGVPDVEGQPEFRLKDADDRDGLIRREFLHRV